MNCQKDDLAVYIGTDHGLGGALFRCIEFKGLMSASDLDGIRGTMHNAWFVEPLSPMAIQLGVKFVSDNMLRPLPKDPETKEVEDEQTV